MTYFADLSPCNYFQFDADDQLTAVGWLEAGHEYSVGDVSRPFVVRLTELLINPWQPMVAAGSHDCPFCRFSRGPRQFILNNTTINMGIDNLFIPGDDCLFVAPSLILHYIDAHGYAPPETFQDAVMDCPEMRSMPYLKAIVKHAPKKMLSALILRS